jgi:hypothetical protein
MNRLRYNALLLFFLFPASGARSAAMPVSLVAQEAVIHREALPQPPADKQISWLVHRGGWGDSPAYGTRLDTDHYDGFLQDYSSGLKAEFDALSALDNAAFIQDFGNVRTLASAAQGSKMGYAVVNTLSPLALKQFRINSPDECVNYLVKQLSTRAEFPGYYSIGGKPIVFVFDVGGFTPDEWKTILRKTRAAYPGEELRFIAQRSVFVVLNTPDPQSYMNNLLDAFDGIMFWGGPQDAKEKNLALARQAIKTLGQDKLVFWVLTNGYWRPEKGMFMDPRGTGVWLDQLKLCFRNEFDGLIIESWNDFEENTDVAPSRENGGVFFELLKYYSAVSNRRAYAGEAPGLMLVHPREILAGETLAVEVLALPVKLPRNSFRLELDDEQGVTGYRSPEQSVPPSAAEKFTFSIPTRIFAGSRRLAYRIVTGDKTFNTGSWTLIRKSKLESPWIQGTVLSRLIPSEGVSFDLTADGGARTAEIGMHHDVPLSRVDIYRDNQPVWSLDAARLDRSRNWRHGPVALELDFQMPQNYAGENSDRSAVLSVTNGALVRGFDKLGKSLVTAPDRAVWSDPPSLGRQFNVKLLVDADDDTCFTAELTALNQTITFTLGELRQQKLLEKMTSAHGRVWIREINHPVVWQVEPGALGTNVNETVVLRPAGEPFDNGYFLWARDVNGKTFRSQPVTVFSKVRKGSDNQWLWDESAGDRFAASVSRSEQRQMIWSFDGSVSRIYMDEAYSGALLRLGGGMYRAGHFEPDAMPSPVDRDRGHALHFDGHDYAQLDAGTFSQGAFELSLDVCPEISGGKQQTLFFCRSNLTLFQTSDGRVGLRYKGLKDMDQPLELFSADNLPLKQWSRINVHYDYQTLVLQVNGAETLVPLAKGPIRAVSAESYLGAEVGGTESTRAGNFFTGGLDNLKIRCGALTGGE